MSEEALKIIDDAMEAMGFNYELDEYQVPEGEEPPDMYFVGEYQEVPSTNEDGMQETAFIIAGFNRGRLLPLEEAKRKIKKYFPSAGGRVAITDSGSAVAIFYANAFSVRTGNAEIKKIEINLTVKEWSVN